MSDANLDAADLAAVEFQGLINEEVMQQIWDISDYPLPFSDSMGTPDSIGNSYASWTLDEQAAPDTDNATIDGADAVGNDTATGERVGNHCQIPDKVVRVSTRARSSDTIGFSDSLAYQVMMRQRDLRRDNEAIFLQPQASVADDGSTIAGRLGGFPSWLVTSTSRGVGGADGGFNAGIVDAPTPGEARAITETGVRDISQSVWEQGGNPGRLMSVPGVIRQLSNYMFTSSARIATLRREAGGESAARAIGAVNVFLTDFDVSLEFVPNRLQQTYASGDGVPVQVANVFIYDTAMVRPGVLTGYRVEDIAKTGTADNRQMLVDQTLKVLSEKAHGLIADIDPTLPATL